MTPQLYRQLRPQLSQWITPKDKRHLNVFAENIAAILQSRSDNTTEPLVHAGLMARVPVHIDAVVRIATQSFCMAPSCHY